MRRWGVRLLEDAIDPVADLERLCEGLDMDVRGAGLHRALDDPVDQPDHRRLAGQVLEVLDVVLGDLAELGPGRVRFGLALRLLVEARHGQLDLRRQTDGAGYPFTRGHGQRVRHEGVAGIRHGDSELRFVVAQRQHAGVLEEAGAE